MPTVLTHPAVPIALGLALGPRVISGRLLATGVVAAVLPDLDVLAFRLGIPYAHDLGHRGASHSLAFAALLGLVALTLAAPLRASRKAAFLFVFAAAASHGLLDMLTNGGLGIALAWPVSDARFFFPVQVIEASPLSLRRFFSSDGAAVMVSELLWVWLPSVLVGMAVFFARRKPKALLMAAAATCLLLLSSCSQAETPADDDLAMVAESIENLEMQADKLAAGTGASCPQEFSALETGRTLRISMFYGYDKHEGRARDRVNARSMSHVLTKECRGKLSACGFSIVSSSQSAVRLMRTLDGRKVEINLFTSSLPDDAKEDMVNGRFYRELVESDIVLYMGHSRLGGGMDFNAQPGVTTLFNAVFRFPMLPVLEALRQRPTKLKMIGMFSCDSNKYFRHDFHGANPSLALILTTGDIYARPAEQASLGALDAVLSKKCARAFQESMMSVNEPNPGMTSLIRGQ